MGGDEFTILVPRRAEPQDAVAAADSLQALLRNPFQIEGHEVVTSASIGIAMRSSETGSADELVRHADMAMYQAKRGAKPAVSCTTPPCRPRRPADSIC